MTLRDIRIVTYVCVAMGLALDYFQAPLLALLFFVPALGGLAFMLYYMIKDLGSGPGPLAGA